MIFNRRTQAGITIFFMGSLALSCGGNSTPSAPTTVSAPGAPTIVATTVPELGNRNSVSITVTSPATGVTSWVTEIGRQSGQRDVSVTTTSSAGATFVIRPLPIGVLYARVYAEGPGGRSSPSAEAVLGSYDPRQIIDAIFMGGGPLAVSGNAGCRTNVMEGWAWGTSVRIQTASGLSAANQTAAADTAAQVASMTAGQVNAFVQTVADPGPGTFNPGSDTIFIRQGTAEEVHQQCRCTSCVGCATSYNRGSFKSGVYVQVNPTTTNATVAHEIGHGIGFCHIISAVGFNPPLTMGVTTDGVFSPSGRSGRMDAVAAKAMETVYAAGMQAGESRNRFISLGLVAPDPTAAALGASGNESSVGPPDAWAHLRRLPAAELSLAAERLYGKGSRIEFDAQGDARVTKLFCEGEDRER